MSENKPIPEHQPSPSDVDVDVTEQSKTGAASGGRGRFNPRLAAIYAVGALIIVIVFALVVSFFQGRSDQKANDTTSDTGVIDLTADPGEFTATDLPDAGLVAMDGEVVDLPGITDGKPAMINFFSRACLACRDEMPALEALHNQAGDDFRLIGVNLGDSAEVTAEFARSLGVTYEIVRDPTLMMVNRLNVSAQPFTIWSDADGQIVGHRYGAMTPEEMRDDVNKYLGVTVPLP